MAVVAPTTFTATLVPPHLRHNSVGFLTRHRDSRVALRRRSSHSPARVIAAAKSSAMEYRKVGDSDLSISEITLGTMTFGEQNTEREAHEILSCAFENGINALDTAEAIIVATKVCGYSERSRYIRENQEVLRVDRANIKERVEQSLKRLVTDCIDLLQIHWPDRYVALFGEYCYDPSKWRPSVPFVEQLRAFQELIDEGKIVQRKLAMEAPSSAEPLKFFRSIFSKNIKVLKTPLLCLSTISIGQTLWLISSPMASASDGLNVKANAIYEVGELFELGIQLSYVLLLLGLLGVGSFFVIRQVLVRRELDLSAKELQEQVRSGDGSAIEYFELGAVMLRRKFYPAAIKYLLQAVDKWDGDDQDLAQVYNALGVSYTLDGKIDKGITKFEMAVKLQPGYVTAWNNLGDAYEKKNRFKDALKAFEEVLLFDPNNPVARPRRDALKEKVDMLRGVPVNIKSKESR